ncbi:hypothetical protein H6F77_20410 [Microcoleus sp. FACHB-831]|uniref:slr1957 family protein n=1 Tax=Microcoleus sp. FACHB-831 TaxID=2692827 RepID=UPI0016832089|nr:hypothetical protein [Microcoleus sp. FACHB-831]MBD1923415.1 hypothetical protein [Microcoleus sp. FACHB-831]
MNHFCDEWIKDWCQENGWTDLFMERRNNYWAFPPGAVMPEPIPSKVLRTIKTEKGLSYGEKVLSISAVSIAIAAAFFSYFLKCPLPLVFAFVFCAVTVGLLEVEDI